MDKPRLIAFEVTRRCRFNCKHCRVEPRTQKKVFGQPRANASCGSEKEQTPDLIGGNAKGCMGGRGFGFISYRGDVQTCGFLNISAGNLIETDFNFGKVWLGSEFLKEIRNLSGYKGNCGICEYIGLCVVWSERAYAISGDYLAADPVCSYK